MIYKAQHIVWGIIIAMRSVFHGLVLGLAGVLLLSSCDWMHSKEKPHAPKAPARIEAEAFIQNLTLARLAADKEDAATLKKHVGVLEAHSKQKAKDVPYQSIVILDYT